MDKDQIIRRLMDWAWEHSQHRWWCKDSWMIGKCNCGSKEFYEFLESLQAEGYK